jgi:hypothetical protein
MTVSAANHVAKSMNSSRKESSLKIMQAKTGNLMRKFPTQGNPMKSRMAHKA